ncbi:MAG: thermonuclease family protein [Chloroflexi bacterium]|nr:thermonuclease family protein [Chloroflexota bacterium]
MPADTPTLVLVQTVIPTVTRSPTVKLPTLSQTSTPSPVTQKPGRVTSQVSRVIDGDTIQVLIAGKTYTVRYIGIDTPETVAPGKPIEWMGAEASEANKSLVGGKSVDLEKDVSETDKYGRLLRYVFVGNVFVNAELVRKGYAKVSTYPPDVKNQSLFLQAQQEARTAGRGLWGIAPVLVSPPTQIPAPRAQPTIAPSRSGNCDSAYPDVCIPRYPPDLDCPEIPYENFRVLPPDPHRFDADKDGIGCEK